MNVVLWVLQALLAAAFAGSGVMKITQSRKRLEQLMPYTADFATGVIRFIGTMELLAAVGLILPAATGIAPVLTPLAATGLGIIMLLAIGVHARRHELKQSLPINLVLLALAAVVAWGRFGPYAL
jgi:uncharacterized membrane protein YphA (DoxX/SURF4 family)